LTKNQGDFTMRVAIAAGVMCLATATAAAQDPPPAAVGMGFTSILFETDFASLSDLAGVLSCAGTPQTAPWKQGQWWEGESDPTGVAPCSQISLARDAAFGHQVLDLAWLAGGNQDALDATAISTFPLDTVSPHFAFRHGYVEVELRLATAAAGVYGGAWTWGDSSVIFANTPPFQAWVPASEFDIVEFGVPQPGSPIWLDAGIREWYAAGTNAYLAGPKVFDMTQPHRYGLLWSPGAQWQGGQVCSYVDDQWQGCQPTTAASEAGQEFLIITMGVACNWQKGDRSCIGGLQRADLLVSRITVWGE
jgi:hypothetical protein